MRKGELMAKELPKIDNLGNLLSVVYEKVSREYQLTQEEVKASTITIKNGEISVKGKK
jgi:hypothetical protein